MNDFLVSIVIPVYKTEKYLDQCVRSALEQSYPALEILLVDDG
ncbi:MAG: glycosyltransferase, partial [Lachnospiraceae bacterium]|nr:glycosyltransferase [Lachnospiraceae bacterium]